MKSTEPILKKTVAFAEALDLAHSIKLLTHYAKGTTSSLKTLFASKIASSGSINSYPLALAFPSRYSSLSLNVSYLALEDGTPIFRQFQNRLTCLLSQTVEKHELE